MLSSLCVCLYYLIHWELLIPRSAKTAEGKEATLNKKGKIGKWETMGQ